MGRFAHRRIVPPAAPGRYDLRMGVVWMLALAGLVCLLMTLALLDRLGFAFSGRSWLPWRRDSRAHAVLATGLDQVTALFYATKHYELDQRKTESMLRDDSTDGAPRRFRLDLDHDRPTMIMDSPVRPVQDSGDVDGVRAVKAAWCPDARSSTGCTGSPTPAGYEPLTWESCSSDWTRTSNPAINSRMLCQLSYGGPFVRGRPPRARQR